MSIPEAVERNGSPEDAEISSVTYDAVKAKVENLLHLDPEDSDSWPQESYWDDGLGAFVLVDTNRIEIEKGAVVRSHYVLTSSGFVVAGFRKAEISPEYVQNPPIPSTEYSLRLFDDGAGEWYGFTALSWSDSPEDQYVNVSEGLDEIIRSNGLDVRSLSPSYIETIEDVFNTVDLATNL